MTELINQFLEHYRNFMTSTDAGAFLLKLKWVDWALLFSLIIGIAYGTKKGFMRMIAEVIQLGLVIFLTMEVYENVGKYLMALIKPLSEQAAAPIAYVVTMSLMWIFVAIIDGYLKQLIHTTLYAPAKYIGGAIIGCLTGVLVLGMLSQAIFLVPRKNTKRVFEHGNSLSGSRLVLIVPAVHEMIREPKEFVKRFEVQKIEQRQAVDTPSDEKESP